ncbi:MAG: hypothetical protein Q6361_06130 [Candidatus Hermodarchaeota archaeon]|nr:hypothetical protein [Candidatus Hermodarchaeota archaeon]
MDYSTIRFKWSLQALAAPAEVQLQLFPDYLWKVDEIAIEFDQWYQVMKRRHSFFSKKQQHLLENLNKKLDEISGPENLHYWLEEALRTDAVWEAIRSLARIVLGALGWPVSEPFGNRSEVLVNVPY